MKAAIIYIVLIAAAVQAAPMMIDIPERKINSTMFTDNERRE